MASTYITDSLSTDEQIEQLFSVHWFSWAFVWFLVIISPFTLGITLLWAIYKALCLKTLEQGVTNKRVVFKEGIISRKTEEMKLSSIETVEIKQSILGRIFGFGSVHVTGRGISDVVFPNIDDPMAVKKAIDNLTA